MANSVKDVGLESQAKWGWWYAHRFLVLRRLVQLLVLMLFLSGPIFGVWILKGNYSASLFLDTVPLTDPLMALQSLLAGHWPALTAFIGFVLILGYGLIGNRLFCGWVCPLNPITDLAAWCRRKLGIRKSATISRSLRYGILVAILVGSALTGYLVWEWINPVALLGRGLTQGSSEGIWLWLRGLNAAFGAGIWLLVAIFLFDLFVVEHGWCGHLCPLGALYGVIGRYGILRVSAEHREKCTRCMDCINICPEAQILREPVLVQKGGKEIDRTQCLACGRCIDVCSEKVFVFKTEFTVKTEYVAKTRLAVGEKNEKSRT